MMMCANKTHHADTGFSVVLTGRCTRENQGDLEHTLPRIIFSPSRVVITWSPLPVLYASC